MSADVWRKYLDAEGQPTVKRNLSVVYSKIASEGWPLSRLNPLFVYEIVRPGHPRFKSNAFKVTLFNPSNIGTFLSEIRTNRVTFEEGVDQKIYNPECDAHRKLWKEWLAVHKEPANQAGLAIQKKTADVAEQTFDFSIVCGSAISMTENQIDFLVKHNFYALYVNWNEYNSFGLYVFNHAKVKKVALEIK